MSLSFKYCGEQMMWPILRPRRPLFALSIIQLQQIRHKEPRLYHQFFFFYNNFFNRYGNYRIEIIECVAQGTTCPKRLLHAIMYCYENILILNECHYKNRQKKKKTKKWVFFIFGRMRTDKSRTRYKYATYIDCLPVLIGGRLIYGNYHFK